MRIVLAGGTGFVGGALRESLASKGHELVILTRQSFRENQPVLRTRYRHWNPPQSGTWENEVSGADAVINLAGEPIVGKRWTSEQKQKISQSRLGATQAIVRAIQTAKKRPFLFLNASAIGYYGPHGDEELTEDSPAGRDFLSETCRAWEAEALRAEEFGIRVVRLRIGIVLGDSGGALSKMLFPFKLGLGGPLGSGRQWMSWIHLKDLIGLMNFLIERKEIRGVVNGTAPNPVRMKEFAETLGCALHRPAFFPAPGFLLKILLGEMADVLLKGQRVFPARARAAGYVFQFSDLQPALEEIIKE
jgi:uncharacterized protein (TIGR01777 family)